MWVLTGERERFCGIHLSGKVNQIADEAAGGGRSFEPVDSPPVVIGVTGTAAIMRCLLLHDSKACIRVSQADRGLVNELVVGMGSRFDRAARSRRAASRPAGARYRCRPHGGALAKPGARKTRPGEMPGRGTLTAHSRSASGPGFGRLSSHEARISSQLCRIDVDQILAKRQGMQRKTYRDAGRRLLVVTLRDTRSCWLECRG